MLAIMAPKIAARDAKNRLVTWACLSAPVRVTKSERSVMMSMQHYERLRGAAWERLLTMDRLG